MLFKTDDRLHRRPQHHAGDRHPRLRGGADPPLNAAIASPSCSSAPRSSGPAGPDSLTIRYPWVVAFCSDCAWLRLRHGLTSPGLPRQDRPWRSCCSTSGSRSARWVSSFSFSAWRAFRPLEIRWPRWVVALPGYTVGTLGAFWTIQRTAILLGGSDDPAARRGPAHAGARPARWTRCALERLAHPRGGEATGFLAGVQHPVSGRDHVLAMIAVGLWGAQLGPPAVWLLPVTFPMVMAFGGTIGLSA